MPPPGSATSSRCTGSRSGRTAGASRSRASDGSSSGTSPLLSPAPCRRRSSSLLIVTTRARLRARTTTPAEPRRSSSSHGATRPQARPSRHGPRCTRSSSSRPTPAPMGRSAPPASPRTRRSPSALLPSSRSTGSPAASARGSSCPGWTAARRPQALVRTATARVSAETGSSPALPGALTQLVSLGLPFGYGEQAPILGHHVPALRISTAPDGGVAPGGDELARSRLCTARPARPCVGDAAQLPRPERRAADVDQRRDLPRAAHRPRMGAAAAAAGGGHPLCGGDARPAFARAAAAASPPRTLGARSAGVWALARCSSRSSALASLVGALPSEPALPPPPDEPPVDSWPLGLLAVLALAAFLVWLRSRARSPRASVRQTPRTSSPRTRLRSSRFSSSRRGLRSSRRTAWSSCSRRSTPGSGSRSSDGRPTGSPTSSLVRASSVPSSRSSCSPSSSISDARAPLYAASLVTTGVIPWGATLALTVWAAIAGLVGAVASGNYAPTEPSRGR